MLSQYSNNFRRRIWICASKIVSSDLLTFVKQNGNVASGNPNDKERTYGYRKPFDKKRLLVPAFVRFCHQIRNLEFNGVGRV